MIKKLKQKIYKLLKWSEKYTQTDMIYLAKGGSWLIFSRLTLIFLGFLLTLAFANLISKQTYGNYKYIISIFSLFSIATLPEIYPSLVQAISRKFEGNFFEATKKRIFYGFLGSLGLFGISLYYFFQKNFLFAKAFLLASFFLPFFYSFETYKALFHGRKRFDLLAKFQILEKFIPTFILILILFLSNNLFLILLSYFLCFTFTRLLVWLFSIKKYSPNTRKDSSVISYGKHLTLIQFLSYLASYLDKVLVFHYLGAASLAIYHFAIVIPDQLSTFLGSLKSLALPRFSERKPQEVKKNLNKKILKFAILISLIVAFYLLLCPLIYKIFFPQYQKSIFYSQIFSFSIFGALAILPHTFLLSQRKVKKLYQYNFLSALIRILFILCGLYLGGLFGLILGRVAARFFNFLILEILVIKS